MMLLLIVFSKGLIQVSAVLISTFSLMIYSFHLCNRLIDESHNVFVISFILIEGF